MYRVMEKETSSPALTDINRISDCFVVLDSLSTAFSPQQLFRLVLCGQSEGRGLTSVGQGPPEKLWINHFLTGELTQSTTSTRLI